MANIATLVMGESGTGKELVARVTGLSRFIPFDTEKLAFTGATEDRNGWLESMTRSSSTRSGSSRWRYR
jgi:DNA-binding NtrC family response regulator